jgi:hypothetical protein
MRQQIKVLSLIVLACLVALTSANASKGEDETQERRFAQFTFITPIGSNGHNSSITTNSLSFNLLYGVSGGVHGFEFGGLHNTTKGDVNGFQLGGLGNLTTGITKGVQFGGLYNVDLNLSNGVQFAGITNVIKGPSKGAHFAGITNFVSNESWAFQAGGIANVTPGGNHGAQLAGITNVNGLEGEGPQFAGLANFNQGRSSNFQAAGLINISTKEVRGAQIAGLVNYTKKLRGFQLALINVSDTVEKGIPLGLISVVKHGYYAFEIEANDAFWVNATYKMGVPKLYNIFTAGFKEQEGKKMWGVGFGFGSILPVGEKWGLNFDLTATHINEDEWWTEDLNLLNRLKINAWYDLGKLKIYGGPSLNVHVSNLKDEEGVPGGNLIDPKLSFYEHTGSDTRTIIYPGFNLGIRF